VTLGVVKVEFEFLEDVSCWTIGFSSGIFAVIGRLIRFGFLLKGVGKIENFVVRLNAGA
jgi:hypothetical protein